MAGFLTMAMSSVLVMMPLLTGCVVAEVQQSMGTKPFNYNDSVQYKDCGDLHKAGYRKSGVHVLYMDVTEPFLIHCEFTKDNAYNVIQRRKNDTVDFGKSWSLYMEGFGDPAGEYWAGLKFLNFLTTQQDNKVLTINMQDAYGNNKTAKYLHFKVGSDSSGYAMSVSNFSGNPDSLEDDFSYHNGMKFATYDNPDLNKCAVNMRAGWWYNECAFSLLNGRYYYPPGPYTPSSGCYDGIYWKDWAGQDLSYGNSLKYVQMSVSTS